MRCPLSPTADVPSHTSGAAVGQQARGRQLRRPYSPRPSSLLSQPALFSVSLVLCQRLVGQFALRTFKRAQIGTSKAALDTDPHHANFALGAARPLDHAREMTFRHVMHSHGQAGAQHSQSPIHAEGGAVIRCPTPAIWPEADVKV